MVHQSKIHWHILFCCWLATLKPEQWKDCLAVSSKGLDLQMVQIKIVREVLPCNEVTKKEVEMSSAHMFVYTLCSPEQGKHFPFFFRYFTTR